MDNLFEAVRKGDLETVRRELLENPSLMESRDEDGYTPLQLAMIVGDPDQVQLLLELGANPDAPRTRQIPLRRRAAQQADRSDPRYPVLRALKNLLPVLAWIAVFGGLILGLTSGICANLVGDIPIVGIRGNVSTASPILFAIPVVLAQLLRGIIVGVILLALAELIELFLDIEMNTRNAKSSDQ